jgi:integrase/recombinase XerD
MEAMKNRLHVGQYMPGSVAAVVEDNESLIKEYLEWKASYAKQASRAYAIWVRRFQEFTNLPPEHLTVSHWTTFAQTLEGRFASKSVQFAMNIIRNYLRFWNEQGRLRSLPLYLARVPTAISCTHNATTEDEYRRLVTELRLKGDEGLRDLTVVMLLHDTGMRVGELTSLEIEDVEEDCSAVIRTEKTVQRRRVFWNQDTDEVLHRYLVQRINNGAKSDALFVRKSGTPEIPLTTRSVERIVNLACKQANISRHLSPHSFRHAFIHRLAALGVPDAIIAQLVGHSTPFTISHYTKLSRTECEQFARKQFSTAALAA